MHSPAHIFLPRSAAAEFTTCLSCGPAPPSMPLGGGAPWRSPPGGAWAPRPVAVASTAICAQTITQRCIGFSPWLNSRSRCQRVEKDGVPSLLQLLTVDIRHLHEGIEAIKSTMGLAVRDDGFSLLLLQTQNLRHLVGRGRVHVDPAVLPDQVIKDYCEFLVGSLGPSFDHPVDQVIPLGSAAAR